MAKKPAIDLGDIGNAVTAPFRAYDKAVKDYNRWRLSTRPDRAGTRKSVGGRTGYGTKEGGAPRRVTKNAARAKNRRGR